MKKIIKEQEVQFDILPLKGKTINLYHDSDEKMYFNRVKLVSIKPLNLDNPLFKEIIMTNEAGENYTFRFECSQPYLWWVSKDGGDNSKKYNKTFIELLRKNLCFFKNGKYVPKADIASVETKTGEPMAEGKKVIRLTESDLVQLIKRIISENK